MTRKWRAETTEAAKRAVEGELQKWKERDQKKAAEAAARILAETEKASESSPRHYKIQKQNQQPTEKIKINVGKSSMSKKALLPNISGIFNRKKNQAEGRSLVCYNVSLCNFTSVKSCIFFHPKGI